MKSTVLLVLVGFDFPDVFRVFGNSAVGTEFPRRRHIQPAFLDKFIVIEFEVAVRFEFSLNIVFKVAENIVVVGSVPGRAVQQP